MLPTPIAFSVPTWLQIAAFPGFLVALCCTLFLWELLRRRRVRRKHLASHTEMDDGEFIRRIGLGRVEVEGEAVSRIRRAIAKLMRVPPSTLHSSDELDYIAAFGFGNRDFVEISWAVEKSLDIRIPMRHWRIFLNGDHNDSLDTLIRFLFDQHFLSPEFSTTAVAAPALPATAPAALPLAAPAPTGPSDPMPAHVPPSAPAQ
jgi:hypothetical protein